MTERKDERILDQFLQPGFNVPEDFDDLQERPESQFLLALYKDKRVFDDTAKNEWAADVERRLRSVIESVNPAPPISGYHLLRLGTCISISTLTPDRLCKKDVARLVKGNWPAWDEIIAAVPEFTSSSVDFDAYATLEWSRSWDVEWEIGRLRAEYGIY